MAFGPLGDADPKSQKGFIKKSLCPVRLVPGWPCTSLWSSVPWAALILNRKGLYQKRPLSSSLCPRLALHIPLVFYPLRSAWSGPISSWRKVGGWRWFIGKGLSFGLVKAHTVVEKHSRGLFTGYAKCYVGFAGGSYCSLEPKSLRLCTTVNAKMYFPGPSQLTRS